MADVGPTQPATPEAQLFSRLVASFGIQGALALMPILNPEASTASKAFAGASLAGTGARAAGNLAGSPSLAGAGQGLGTALGLAGTGYNFYNTVTDPNLSTGQRVGHSGRNVSDAIMSYFIPYYGLGKAATVGAQALERSGSPQLRGLGRSVDYAVEPSGAKGFWDVVQGDASPAAAFKKEGGLEGLTLDLMGPVGIILRGLGVHLPGLYSPPTEGTQFRTQMQQVFSKLGLPSFNRADPNVYTAGADPASYYKRFDPTAVSNAQQLGQLLAQLSPIGKKNDAYGVQAQNILLSTLGNSVVQKYPDLLKQLQGG